MIFLGFAVLSMMAAPTETIPLANEAEQAQSMTPAGNPGFWATNDDYPARAMLEEREGTSGFLLTVDANGKPTGCDIISSSGHADLDEATCRVIMARARFLPERDARGRAVGGTYSNRIRWQIPQAEHEHADRAGFGLRSMLKSWPRSAIPEPMMMSINPVDHYPESALSKREEGVVEMALDIDVEGQVAGCRVTESSGSIALDAASCALMQREGKFAAALDGTGNPTSAVFVAEFSWVLPPEAAAPDEEELAEALGDLPGKRRPPFPMREPGSGHLSIMIKADGSIGKCRFEGKGALVEQGEGMNPCMVFEAMAPFAPILDEGGRPRAQQIHVRTDMQVNDVTAAEEEAAQAVESVSPD